MTNKHTDKIQAVEQMIFERLDILQNGETKEIKKKARREIINLEKHLRNVNDKDINGKTYPERMKGFPDDKPMDQKELKKLIDDIDCPDEDKCVFTDPYNTKALLLEGEYLPASID